MSLAAGPLVGKELTLQVLISETSNFTHTCNQLLHHCDLYSAVSTHICSFIFSDCKFTIIHRKFIIFTQMYQCERHVPPSLYSTMTFFLNWQPYMYFFIATCFTYGPQANIDQMDLILVIVFTIYPFS